jgi:hypothetical protein
MLRAMRTFHTVRQTNGRCEGTEMVASIRRLRSCLYGLIEPLEADVSFRSALVQFGDMLAPRLRALLATV